jgi:ribosomal protein L37AE/L43A
MLDCYTETAIIHNGVMFNPLIQDYSDTAIFARTVGMFNPSIDWMTKVIGQDRLVLFSHDDTILLGQWHEIDGNMYSNLYSLQSRYSKTYTSYKKYSIACPMCENEDCEHIGLSTDIYECLDCSTVFNLDGDMILSKNKNSFEDFVDSEDYYLNDYDFVKAQNFDDDDREYFAPLKFAK